MESQLLLFTSEYYVFKRSEYRLSTELQLIFPQFAKIAWTKITSDKVLSDALFNSFLISFDVNTAVYGECLTSKILMFCKASLTGGLFFFAC